MRLIRLALAAILVAATPAFAQLTGLKQHVGNKLNDAIQQHNDELDKAMGGDQPNPQPQDNPTPPVVTPGEPLPIKSGWLTRKSTDESTTARLYFAYPLTMSKTNPAPGLIVLQEWWGVNDDIQQRTQDFAKRGFYAVAVDLYNGQTTDDPTRAASLKAGMNNDLAMKQMKIGLDLLAEESTNGVVDHNRVGAIGWCMGGEQALLLAMNDDRVKATVIFYGPLVTDPDKLKNVNGPVLGIFGNNDKAPSPDDVNKFEAALKQDGKTDLTIYRFDGVGHAFASKSATKMGMYNEDKAKDAWEKTWSWLNQKLLTK